MTNHSEDESSDDEEEVQQYATAAAVFNNHSLKARTQRILNRGRDGTLKHHVWDPKTNWWTVCSTVKPHAKLDIVISVHRASYTGRRLPILPGNNSMNGVNTNAVLDSGAQITIIPRKLVDHMGIDMSNMDKSHMRIRSIDNSRVATQRALCLNITAKTKTGFINIPTMVYVIPDASSIFLDLKNHGESGPDR